MGSGCHFPSVGGPVVSPGLWCDESERWKVLWGGPRSVQQMVLWNCCV